jgi:hypothetical protein
MSIDIPRHYRRSAWLAGLLVLMGVGIALWTLFSGERATHGAPPAVDEVAGSPEAPVPVPPKLPSNPQVPDAPNPGASAGAAESAPGRRVAGFVRLPNGQPAAGATVTAHRALSVWPEWRRERIAQATTREDGAFQFGLDSRTPVLLEYSHPSWAGGLVEVALPGGTVELQLQRGFELFGVVTNDLNSPLANVRVAVESVLADQRRATVVTTAANGRYRIGNLPAGPVRLVARHPLWQPATVPVIVVGATNRVDLSFDRPALSAVRGKVQTAIGQSPIAEATIELLSPNAKLGLVDPVAAVTDTNGAFELTGLSRGTVQALVRHPGYGTVVRTLAIGGSATELVFELPPRRPVRAQLTLNGTAQPEWVGMLVGITDTAGEVAYGTVDDAGQVEFPGRFSPGWTTFSLLRGEYAFQRSRASVLKLRLAEGDAETIDLSLVPATLVRGKVVDEQGRPLAGVLVQQTRMLVESARWLGDAAVSLDVGAFGSQVVQLVGGERDMLLAMTGADGSFTIRGQQPGPLLTRFDLPGRGGRWLRIRVPDDERPLDLEPVTMMRGGRILGRVLRGTTPLAGAAVTILGGESQTMVVSRSDGSFVVDDLQAGEYRVRARLPSMPTASAEEVVQVKVDEAPPNLRLVLPAGRTVRGLVSGSDGQPVPSALVTVTDSVGQPTLTDPAGRFVIELPERAIQLQVSLADRSRRSLVAVPRSMRDVEVKLDTPPLCTLTAQVYGLPGRKRPPGALLRLASLEGGIETSVRTRWVEMANGELTWPLCPVGRVAVEIRCEGYAPWTLEREFVANEEQALGEILLEPGSRLRGLVVDGTGAPVANASVLLGEEADLDLFESAVRTAADGTFAIGGVTTRSCSVVVHAAGFAAQTVLLQLPQDVLSPKPLVVKLDAGATIAVEVQVSGRSRAGGLVQLRRAGRVLAVAEVDEEGLAEFHNRSPGLYSLQLYGSDEAGQEVRVEAGAPRVAVRL